MMQGAARFVSPLPPVTTIGTARALLYARPEVDIFPKTAGVEWVSKFDFRDPFTYGGTLPTHGDSVNTALSVGGFPFAAALGRTTKAINSALNTFAPHLGNPKNRLAGAMGALKNGHTLRAETQKAL
jgi:hypothetical protein